MVLKLETVVPIQLLTHENDICARRSPSDDVGLVHFSHWLKKNGGLLFFDPIQLCYATTGMDPNIIWAACQFFVGNCLCKIELLDPEKIGKG